MAFGKEIARRIHDLRISQGLTQEKLAEKAGIDPTMFGRIERGQRANLTVNTLEKIVTALDIDYPTFFSFGDSSDRTTVVLSRLALLDQPDEVLAIIESVIDLAEATNHGKPASSATPES